MSMKDEGVFMRHDVSMIETLHVLSVGIWSGGAPGCAPMLEKFPLYRASPIGRVFTS